jgi:transposase-like protein
MTKSRWDSKSKAIIVVEGLRGKPVADICREYQISQSYYYKWRDRFLAQMHRAFEDRSSRELELSKQVGDLKKIVAELTLELKKSESDW